MYEANSRNAFPASLWTSDREHPKGTSSTKRIAATPSYVSVTIDCRLTRS